MRRVSPRTTVQSTGLSPQEYVGLCSAALWGLAALYLLVTFQPY
jgi:hypothetical protein